MAASSEAVEEPKQRGVVSPRKARGLRIALVITLIVFAVQGWTGDAVNIFVTTANGTTSPVLWGVDPLIKVWLLPPISGLLRLLFLGMRARVGASRSPVSPA